MKVKDILDTIDKYQEIQIYNAKVAEPWSKKSYLADNENDISEYEDYDVFGIAPKVDSDNKTYLAILIVLEK